MDATDKLGSSKNTETNVLEGFCLYDTKTYSVVTFAQKSPPTR